MEKGLTAEFTTPSLSFVQISSPTHCWLKAKGKQVVGSKQDHKKHMLMWCFGFTGSRCAREQSDMGTGKKKKGWEEDSFSHELHASFRVLNTQSYAHKQTEWSPRPLQPWLRILMTKQLFTAELHHSLQKHPTCSSTNDASALTITTVLSGMKTVWYILITINHHPKWSLCITPLFLWPHVFLVT